MSSQFRSHWAIASVLALAIAACGGSSTPNDTPDPTWVAAADTLTLTDGTSPIDGLPAGTRYIADIPYGSDAEQAFDAFFADGGRSRPRSSCGCTAGGFVGGSRKDAYADAERIADAKKVLTAGAAWLNVDYRLLAEVGVETVGVQKSLHDSRRALQFIRYHAASLNIDPTRVAMYGVSAGAGTAVWLGFHDDMKESSNGDRIARESTRLAAIAGLSTQGTYDVLRWAPDIYGPEYPIVTNDLLLQVKASVQLLLRFYGLPAELANDTNALVDKLNTPSYLAYRADLDMFVLASPDDPPLLLRTPGPDTSPLAAGFDVLHHPLHPKTLYEMAQTAGVKTIVIDVPAYQLTSSTDTMDFLLSHI